MSRTKSAIKIIVASSLNQLMVVVAGLILPPLLISHYGSEVNGLVNSVKQMLNYFTVISVGLGAASQVALYKPLATKDWSRVSEIMSVLGRFLNKASVFFLLLIGAFAFILPALRSDGIDQATIAGVVVICGLGTLIEFSLLTRYKILLTADQKQYVVSNVYTQGTIINTVLSVILIYFDASIIWVQFSATFAYLIRMLLLIRKVRSLYPSVNMKKRDKDVKIPGSQDAFLYKLSDILINYIPMTLVTIMCGYADASVFTIYNLVFSAIVMIVNIFSNGLAASFGNLVAEGNLEKLRQSFRGYNFAFRFFSFFCYACAAILIIPFVSVYIRNSDGVNYLLPVVGVMFSINGISRAIRTPYITLVDAIGNYHENVRSSYFEVFLNLIVSIICTHLFGLVGVLIGGTVSAIIRSLQFLFLIDNEVLNESQINDVILIISNFICSIILYFILSSVKVSGLIEWVLAAVPVAVITGISLILLNVILDFRGFKELSNRLHM